MPRTLILASGSPQRYELLSALGIPFDVIPSGIDEKAVRDGNSAVRVEKIARTKAMAVAAKHDGVVIAADTFVVHQSGRVLEKPTSPGEARVMLRLHSGSENNVQTGFCYIDRAGGIDCSATVNVAVRFRDLTDQEIDRYVATQPVLTWSGAFNAGDFSGQALIAEVRESITALNGLPLDALVPLLKRSGFL